MKRRRAVLLGVAGVLTVAALIVLSPGFRAFRRQEADRQRAIGLGCTEACCAAQAAEAEDDWRSPRQADACDIYYYGAEHLAAVDRIRRTIAEAIPLRPGQWVADIGAGQGALVMRLGPLLAPGGRIYATDIDPAAIRLLEGLAASGPGAGIVVPRFVQGPRDTGLDDLPEGSLAAIYIITSVAFEHGDDVEEDVAYLKRLRRLLADDGVVVYHTDWVDAHLLDRDELVALFRRAGFGADVRDIPLPPGMPAETCYCAAKGDRGEPRSARLGYLLAFPKGQDPAARP